MKEGRFTSDLKKKLFTVREERPGKELPRKVEDAPPLGVFKAMLHEALCNLV